MKPPSHALAGTAPAAQAARRPGARAHRTSAAPAAPPVSAIRSLPDPVPSGLPDNLCTVLADPASVFVRHRHCHTVPPPQAGQVVVACVMAAAEVTGAALHEVCRNVGRGRGGGEDVLSARRRIHRARALAFQAAGSAGLSHRLSVTRFASVVTGTRAPRPERNGSAELMRSRPVEWRQLLNRTAERAAEILVREFGWHPAQGAS